MGIIFSNFPDCVCAFDGGHLAQTPISYLPSGKGALHLRKVNKLLSSRTALTPKNMVPQSFKIVTLFLMMIIVDMGYCPFIEV